MLTLSRRNIVSRQQTKSPRAGKDQPDSFDGFKACLEERAKNVPRFESQKCNLPYTETNSNSVDRLQMKRVQETNENGCSHGFHRNTFWTQIWTIIVGRVLKAMGKVY